MYVREHSWTVINFPEFVLFRVIKIMQYDFVDSILVEQF
jgi:hypothetical protein